MGLNEFTFSKHALERILDMDVPPSEVRRCLENPVEVGMSHRGDGRLLYFGDRITCIVNEDTLLVVTVVWRTLDYWKKDLRRGEYGGRSVRM